MLFGSCVINVFSLKVITRKTDEAASLKTETLSRPGLNHMPPRTLSASPNYTCNGASCYYSAVSLFSLKLLTMKQPKGTKAETEFSFGTPLEMNKQT